MTNQDEEIGGEEVLDIELINKGTPEFDKAGAEIDKQITEMERCMTNQTDKVNAGPFGTETAKEGAADFEERMKIRDETLNRPSPDEPQDMEDMENTTPSAQAQSIDVSRVEGMSEIHGLEQALCGELPTTTFTYHVFAQLIQPGTIGLICGLYAFPFRINNAENYMQARVLIANQNQVEVGKLMLVNFQLVDG